MTNVCSGSKTDQTSLLSIFHSLISKLPLQLSIFSIVLQWHNTFDYKDVGCLRSETEKKRNASERRQKMVNPFISNKIIYLFITILP
jgi:hypothetical protein